MQVLLGPQHFLKKMVAKEKKNRTVNSFPVTDSLTAYCTDVKEYAKAKAVCDNSFKLMPDIYSVYIYI